MRWLHLSKLCKMVSWHPIQSNHNTQRNKNTDTDTHTQTQTQTHTQTQTQTHTHTHTHTQEGRSRKGCRQSHAKGVEGERGKRRSRHGLCVCRWSHRSCVDNDDDAFACLFAAVRGEPPMPVIRRFFAMAGAVSFLFQVIFLWSPIKEHLLVDVMGACVSKPATHTDTHADTSRHTQTHTHTHTLSLFALQE